jgi:hypothetical protein
VPKQKEYFQYLQEFQSMRLRRDYADLAVQPQYTPLANFFFNDLYGPQDFQARDNQARRLHHFIHMAPGLTMRDVEVSLDLLDVTMQLDLRVATQLQQMDAPLPFDEATYEEAYYRADDYQPRIQQIKLIREALTRVHRLTQVPLLGTALANSKTLARLAGMRELHAFLQRGYNALKPVDDLEPFLARVDELEYSRLDRIYGVKH